jgi:hypothetical protein
MRLHHLHDPGKALLMALPQSLRDDQLKRAPNRLLAGMPEDSLGPEIPKPNDAIAVGRDNGVGLRREDRFGEQVPESVVLLVRAPPAAGFIVDTLSAYGLLGAAAMLQGYAGAGTRRRWDGLG